MAAPQLSNSKLQRSATVKMETSKKPLKSKNVNEEALKDWLISMAAGQELLQDKVLRPASLGTLAHLWKQITQQIMPAQKCKQIRDNIFLNAINRQRRGEHPYHSQLTLQTRKKDLEQQKQLLLNKREQQTKQLQSALEETLNNKTKLEIAKQELLNVRRKRVLLTEFRDQIKSDIKHSENVKQVLSVFDKNVVRNPIVKYNFIDNLEAVDVKNLLNEVHMSDLWGILISEREQIVNLIMKMATSINLSDEFAAVEKNAVEKYNARPWKDGVVDLNTIFLKIVFSTMKYQKDFERLNAEKNNLLNSKMRKSYDEQIELLKLNLQMNALKQNIASQKDFIQSLKDKKDIFSVDVEDNFDYSVDVADVRQEIASVQKGFEAVEESLKNNLSNIIEGIPKMKENRCKVLEILGRENSANLDSFNSNKLANLFESVLSSNTSKRSIESVNLIDVKEKFSDLKIAECIAKQHKILTDEVNFLSDFNLEANRKLIFNNGTEIWFSETDAGRQIPHVEEINNLLPPFANASSSIKKYLNLTKWKSSLEKLQTDFENTEKMEKEKSVDINTSIGDDVSSSDMIKKMAKSTMKNLQHVQELCHRFDEKVKFFNDVKWKNYISRQREHNGISFIEYEEKYKQFIREMN